MNSDLLSGLSGPVAITGATGFIGRALCQRLEPSRQVVRALSRQADSRLPDTVTVVRGDLSSSAALRALVRDAAWVVHCAGAVRGASRRAFDAVNVDGTAALLDAMAAAAPKARLLHVSTLAAAQPQLSDYAASKRSAELLVTTRGQSGDLILRPTAVYGPGDKELKPLLDQAMRGRLPRPVGSRRISLLHIDDLVDALVLAMGTTPGEASPYPLADARAQGYRWSEIAAAAERLRGDPVRVFPVPKTLLYLLSLGATLTAKALGDEPMLTPGKVRELTFEDWSCDSSAFRARTGWTPQISLDAGLRSLYP